MEVEEYESIVESAIAQIASGDKDQMKLGVYKLRESMDLPISSFKYPKKEIEILIISVEILMGLKKSKADLIDYFTSSILVNGGKLLDLIKSRKLEYEGKEIDFIRIHHDETTFLTEKFPSIILNSLKYEALKKKMKCWEEEDKLDSERMKKIKEIIGD